MSILDFFVAVDFLDIFLNADDLKDLITYREIYSRMYKVKLYGFWNGYCSRRTISDA